MTDQLSFMDDMPADHPLIGKKARAHYNLHKGGFSITIKGLVVANVGDVTLTDVVFKVSIASRERCHRLGKRTVHAWVVGTIVAVDSSPDLAGLERVSYSPYRGDVFTSADGSPVHTADRVVFANDPGNPGRGYGWI